MELEEIKYEREVSKRRFKELKTSIECIGEILSKNNNEELISAVGNLSENVNHFIEVITNFKIENPPEVKVELNHQKVLDKIDIMTEKICSEISELKSIMSVLALPRKTVFDIQTDSVTQKITSVVSETTYIKPKAQA